MQKGGDRVLLGRLIDNISKRSVKNFNECEVTGVSEDSRAIKTGEAYVCIRGVNNDGNFYINDAISRGAVAVITEKEPLELLDVTVIIVENARKSIAEIASLIYGHPENRLKLIAVTGTKGKTTTASMIHRCLTRSGARALLLSTLGVDGIDSTGINTNGNTTPGAAAVYAALARAVRGGAEYAVIEVSSQALSQFRVYGLPFYIAVFTSFSDDHVGYAEHASLQDYFNAKRSLFRDYGVKIAVVNSDDPAAYKISQGVKTVISVGKSEKFDYYLGRIFSRVNGIRFELNGKPFILRMGGEYNAKNAALALACAKTLLKIPLSDFDGAFDSFTLPGRYERYSVCGKQVIIDFAHNGASFREIMNAVRTDTSGRVISVFGSVGGRAEARRASLAGMAEKYSDLSVITSDNPNFENPADICADIYGAFADKSKAVIVEDREKAIHYALEIAIPGDTVLLLGKGHEEYQIKDGIEHPFSERAILKELGAVRFY